MYVRMIEDRMQENDWTIVVMNEMLKDDWLKEVCETTDVCE